MNFEFQPTLTGELVVLRPLREEDWPELFAVASDPLIWELHPSRDRYKEEVFRKFFQGAMESGGAFAVIDRKTGRIIGSTRFAAFIPRDQNDSIPSEIEIGWTFLARQYWGGIYNGEMKQLMIKHAFQYVERVLLAIGMKNFRSQRAAEKIGAVRVDRRAVDDTGAANYVYEIRRSAIDIPSPKDSERTRSTGS